MENKQQKASKKRVDKPKDSSLMKKNHKVIVTGYPAFTQPAELELAFSSIGIAQVENFTARNATLVFAGSQPAQKAVELSGKLILYSHFLNVRHFHTAMSNKKENNENRNERAKEKRKGETFKPLPIDLSGNFHQQLASVLGVVRLNCDEVARISTLYADVELVLQEYWPGCSAVAFGSITTGLAIKGSDADCYVHIPTDLRRGETLFVTKAKKILQRYKTVFREVLSIPKANTPIVKFFHVPTGTACDLSFKSPLGSRNSQLIAFLMHADPRILPVTVFIKYWAKVCGITGNGKMSNYALTMLVIFYLQQISILPAVTLLQKDNAYDYIIDNWNVGFLSQYDAMPPLTNEASLPELIGGFFEYYSEFDFQHNVVCPFLGRPIEKCKFLDLDLLPSEFALYKQNVSQELVKPLRVRCSLCIQSPFEQSHNVASAISEFASEKVNAFIKFAAKAYANDKPNNCNRFLKKILLEKPVVPRKTPKASKQRIHLSAGLLSNIHEDDWQSVVRQLIYKIFEDSLKLKLEHVVSVDDLNFRKETYSTTVNKTIWVRKRFDALYSLMPSLSFFEKQARITEEIIRIDPSVLSIRFKFDLTFNLRRFVSIKFLEEKDASTNFKYFASFITKFILMCFRESILNTKNSSCEHEESLIKTQNSVESISTDKAEWEDDDILVVSERHDIDKDVTRELSQLLLK